MPGRGIHMGGMPAGTAGTMPQGVGTTCSSTSRHAEETVRAQSALTAHRQQHLSTQLTASRRLRDSMAHGNRLRILFDWTSWPTAAAHRCCSLLGGDGAVSSASRHRRHRAVARPVTALVSAALHARLPVAATPVPARRQGALPARGTLLQCAGTHVGRQQSPTHLRM